MFRLRSLARTSSVVNRGGLRCSSYYVPTGGHPTQETLLTDRAVFTEAYAVIPKGVMRDIVTSLLPYWAKTRAWIIARPLSGFAETFSQYIVEVEPNGGSAPSAEVEADVEGVLFVVGGTMNLKVNDVEHELKPGGYAFLPPGSMWSAHNFEEEGNLTFHWVRKRYEALDGIPPPKPFVTSDAAVEAVEMPGTNGGWATTRFADPKDIAHDMHVNIVTFKPGCVIPFCETHVMEHGLYVLEGKAAYKLNKDWVEVQAGDFLWLRAFCPQACYAGGPTDFRYLLYKDVNRHAAFPSAFRR